MFCNLWHIKQTNGLFYYALDYISEVNPRMLVLVRPALFNATRKALPNNVVQIVDVTQLVSKLILAAIRGEWVFTPTAHPFPFLHRQLVVIHDDYPFINKNGHIKRQIFRSLLAISRCQIGHINHSSALGAIPKDIVPSERIWYIPNRGPSDEQISSLYGRRQANRRIPGHPITVALFGTDTRKKRYECLFSEIRRTNISSNFVFRIYGHNTDYYRELKREYSDLAIELSDSSCIGLEIFLANVDCVASVAAHEGFGRPIALALGAGVPCFLIQSDPFEEFFGQSLRLHENVDKLVDALLNFYGNDEPVVKLGNFSELFQIRAAFNAAVNRLSCIAADDERILK